MRVIDIDFSNVLLSEEWFKTYKNISIYDISYKMFMGLKSWCNTLDVDVFVKIYDGIKYLVLFCSGVYNAIYNRIRYVISEKSDITDIINHNFARIRIDSYQLLPTEKTIDFSCFNTY